MTVQSSLLNNMIQSIPDPKLRETYGAIAAGKMSYSVHCMNPQNVPGKIKLAHKKGELVGFIDLKGRVIDEPVAAEDGGDPVSGIETSRDRFDGRKGFKCYCGNDSIRSDEEKAVIGDYDKTPVFSRPPTRDELGGIFNELQKSGKTPGYEFINGSMEYDGFKLEEIKV